jgi:hypothetical protein
LRGLDWLNFLLADVQSGVGPFLAIYLADCGWNEQRVGLVLTIGGIAGIASQTPAARLSCHNCELCEATAALGSSLCKALMRL